MTDNSLLTKDFILSFLKEQKKFIHTEFGITQIGLFGSYARNEAEESSDIDIAIVEMPQKSFEKKFYFKEFLENNFQKKVDVVYLDGMRAFIKKRVLEDIIYV